MEYRVELARNAEVELEALYLWVVERAPSQCARWCNGLEKAILALEQFPKRHRIAPESFDPHKPVRVLNYGRSPHVYRVFSRSTRASVLSKSFISGTERGGDLGHRGRAQRRLTLAEWLLRWGFNRGITSLGLLTANGKIGKACRQVVFR
jgi:plasmid stabilization system protein ParE